MYTLAPQCPTLFLTLVLFMSLEQLGERGWLKDREGGRLDSSLSI